MKTPRVSRIAKAPNMNEACHFNRVLYRVSSGVAVPSKKSTSDCDALPLPWKPKVFDLPCAWMTLFKEIKFLQANIDKG